jgi:hypothetical protein
VAAAGSVGSVAVTEAAGSLGTTSGGFVAPIYRVDHATDGDTVVRPERSAGSTSADRHARSLRRRRGATAARPRKPPRSCFLQVREFGFFRSPLRTARRPVRSTLALRRSRQRRNEREHPPCRDRCCCTVLPTSVAEGDRRLYLSFSPRAQERGGSASGKRAQERGTTRTTVYRHIGGAAPIRADRHTDAKRENPLAR